MSSDKFRCGFDYDVRSVLQRPYEVRGRERVVDDQGDPVLVGDLRELLEIGYIGVRVSQRLCEQRFGLLIDRLVDLIVVIGLHEFRRDAVGGQCVLEEVVRSPVDGFRGHDVVPGVGEVEDRVRYGCCARSQGQSGRTSFEGGDTFLEDVLSRVGETPVDVPRIPEAEPVGCMLGVVEHVRGGQVDRNGPGIRDRIGLLLTYMELQGLEPLVLCVVGACWNVIG